VLHDNRGNYGDSRDYGPVERRDIVGQPLFVAYSASPEDGLRWSRVASASNPSRRHRERGGVPRAPYGAGASSPARAPA